ncbi:acetyl-CoA C-acetyltransferase [uncultured Cohaesibacter sp.]|uniref:acetyl-CoA C-acetyltransferase n=1 Tax=uncultured Cohaesibacter sp. TaxID=1002546 RepID=UPI0029312311|nr:acetyl-CoA C-acetyltransferase [uncultured Cohaesibacter sp.]
MKNIVIASAVRTAIGKFGGSLSSVPAVELGARVAAEAIKRASITPDMVDEVLLGNVLQGGLGQNPARQASLKAGLPESVPASTLNIVCGSGLKSVIMGAQMIASESNQIMLVGGMENMSAAPYLIDKARWGLKMNDGTITDMMIQDGLFCAMNGYHMGFTAENVAEKYGISRAEQDRIAFQSQSRAARAIQSGAFMDEILPVTVNVRKQEVDFSTDEHVRLDTSLEGLEKLRPAFKPDGTVTAGNASGINDGAAALILVSEDRARALGLPILARIRGFGTAGVDPAYMGMGPVPATLKALEQARLEISDLDLIEANEAFASQFAAVGKELGLNEEKTNVNGGAIAIGHPIGASGARILVTLLHALMKRDGTLGLATLCVGGGMGVSLIVERI